MLLNPNVSSMLERMLSRVGSVTMPPIGVKTQNIDLEQAILDLKNDL